MKSASRSCFLRLLKEKTRYSSVKPTPPWKTKSLNSTLCPSFSVPIKHTFQSESWSSEVVDGRSVYERAKLANRTNQDCLIMISRGGESDLNSRWLNSVDSDGLVTEACFAMYWNTSGMTLFDRLTLASQSNLQLSIYVPKEVFDLLSDNFPDNVTVVKY